ncbi:MAG: acyltransferase family protein [Thermoplasmatota archaeon]
MADRDPSDAGRAAGVPPLQPALPSELSSSPAAAPIDPAHPAFGPVPEGIQRPWMPALQSLRGLAALWVVLYHLDFILLWTPAGILPWPGLRFGWLGVDLFFVLSAYLLSQPFFGARPPRAKTFLADRFLRIAPSYYVAFALAVVLILALHPAGRDLGLAWWSLVFLQNFDLQTFNAVNPVFWTLAVEMQFYLVLPLMVRAFRGRWWVVSLAACLACALLYRGLLYGEDEAAIMVTTFTFPAFLGHFGLGMAAARLGRIRTPIGSGLRRAIFLAGVPLVVAPLFLWIPAGSIGYGFEDLKGQILVRTVCACGFALIVLATASGGKVAQALAWAPLAWLGAISYSLYLVHVPLQSVAEWLFDPATDRTAFVAAGALLSLAGGWLLYLAVEAPAERWRRRRKREGERGRAEGAPAARQP